MAARKLQQEVDKCFKKVTEGVAEFDAIYEKIGQSSNMAQKEKLEDNLKREIKKLQRLRDQIKTWAAGNEIKDKGPLMENRRLIETQMERFKAVEKAMKTKAYSKEGLSAATKLDPKDQAKHETTEFINTQVDELEQQIEALEAERESIQATVKRGKLHGAKADRMSRIDAIIDRHKFHQGKLELIRRSLENGGVDVEQVNELEESIRYYVTDGMSDDFNEDEYLYDDLNLDEDEDVFGMNQDKDSVSQQDSHSVQGDADPEPAKATPPAAAPPAATPAPPPPTAPAKSRHAAVAANEPSAPARKAAQVKSPLPAVATLHTPASTLANGSGSGSGSAAPPGMKPAAVPMRPAGETLKYASAAAAAAASDKLGLGISPLPPPLTAVHANKQHTASATNSPRPAAAHPVASSEKAGASPAVAQATPAAASGKESRSEAAGSGSAPPTTSRRGKAAAAAAAAAAASASKAAAESGESSSKASSHANGARATASAAATKPAAASAPAPASAPAEAADTEEELDECVYHLPESLRDLLESYETTKARNAQAHTPGMVGARLEMLAHSNSSAPDALDGEPARRYFPDVRYVSGLNFPTESLALLDDPRLYKRLDTDTLFYVFYYKQGTHQQYLAAQALKDMSWRFHKQYQTWFQRHDNPENITEEYEQGTYRFFDYESTWMNRRKADFKFVYKYLEDEV